MDCISEKKLNSHIEGLLNPIESSMINDHLIVCPGCKRKYNELKAIEEVLEEPILIKAPIRIQKSVMRQINSDVSYYSSITALIAASFLFLVTTLYIIFDFANNSLIKSFENATANSGGIVSTVIKVISGIFKLLYSFLTICNIFLKTIFNFNPGVEFIAIFSIFTSFIIIFLIYSKVLKKDWKK